MKVFDSIKNKNIDELAEWLDEHCDSDCALWWKWWDKNYCNKCEAIESETANVFGYTTEYAYCELNGNCKFFKDMKDIPNSKQIIKMWLNSELCVKNEKIQSCNQCLRQTTCNKANNFENYHLDGCMDFINKDSN